MAHLIIKRPGQSEHREVVPEGTIGRGEVTIGRGDGNTIVIDDSRISREHAILTPDVSGHRIRDLGSRNGTIDAIDDSRISREHAILTL